MPADAGAAADLVGALAGADGRDRTASRAVDLAGSTIFRRKDPYYILPIAMAITMYLIDEDDAATGRHRSGAAEDDALDAADVRWRSFFNLSSGLNLYMFTSNLVPWASSII